MLTVRGYSSHDAWSPGPLITQPQALADPEAANALSSATATSSGVVPPVPAVEDDGIPPGTPEFILKDPLLLQLVSDHSLILVQIILTRVFTRCLSNVMSQLC
jgi:hypothetical protein